MMKSGAELTRSIFLISAIFAASIAVVSLLGYFSHKANGSQTQLNIPSFQFLSAPHDSKAAPAAASQFSSKFMPTARRRTDNKLLEQGLARARAAIRKAATNRSISVIGSNGILSWSAIYGNPGEFLQSYREMERNFKVYVYQEGEPPIVHDGPCKDIYSSEGRFIHEMEHGNTRLQELVSDYVQLISTKHPFWNRTQGADHFMLSCHDWGPHATQGNAFLYNTSIRVLCNANSSEGFNPQKDVSLPEIHLYGGVVNPKLASPPPPSNMSSRPYLAFFSGGMHGPIRPILLQYWKGKDPDIRVYEYDLPAGEDYYNWMLRSKFCLCPSGYEVASPRIVEAVYAECVPVVLSSHYVLPFSDVLRWEAFSLRVDVWDIPRLREILVAVSEDEYLRLREGLRAVRRHFVLNQPAKRFDMFHMILHSVWLRRLNLNLNANANA
ncbi:probable glycosyltransferase At5g25310 isoform X2 [Andrographis paniculata]|uniref:probable glycosyltransferase At5g25310 isoform X2 n=1 Tax=Andrographis paniculata TaxID=175694 RepID=UPI0021E73A40|nr:probable glycosyltransferase At5g25310 isoform X2 [Andrographis paniculata]